MTCAFNTVVDRGMKLALWNLNALVRVSQEKICMSIGDQVPNHLKKLFETARQGCQGEEQANQLGQLLCRYQDVFSRSDEDVGQTTLVKHSIPVAEGTRPLRQPPHRLVLRRRKKRRGKFRVSSREA